MSTIDTPETPLMLVEQGGNGYSLYPARPIHALRVVGRLYCGQPAIMRPYPATYTSADGERRSLLDQVTCRRCKRSLVARGAR